MFGSFRKLQRDAFAPIVELAKQRQGYERQVFLEELRRDAPTVAPLVEAIIAEEGGRSA